MLDPPDACVVEIRAYQDRRRRHRDEDGAIRVLSDDWLTAQGDPDGPWWKAQRLFLDVVLDVVDESVRHIL